VGSGGFPATKTSSLKFILEFNVERMDGLVFIQKGFNGPKVSSKNEGRSCISRRMLGS